MAHALNIAIGIDAHHSATRCSRHSCDEHDGSKQELVVDEETKYEITSKRHDHQARNAGNKRTPVFKRLENRAFGNGGAQNEHCAWKRELPNGG